MSTKIDDLNHLSGDNENACYVGLVMTIDNVIYETMPAPALDTNGAVYVPVSPEAGHHSVTSLEYPERRLAVAPDHDMAVRIACMAVSPAGGYSMVIVRASNDAVTHTDSLSWLSN